TLRGAGRAWVGGIAPPQNRGWSSVVLSARLNRGTRVLPAGAPRLGSWTHGPGAARVRIRRRRSRAVICTTHAGRRWVTDLRRAAVLDDGRDRFAAGRRHTGEARCDHGTGR